jgi:hypothetical protein
MEGYAGRQFVGMDLHRRRSVLVRMTAEGEVLERVRIVNSVEGLAAVIGRAGQSPEVVLEATYGWYWAVDALREQGARVHLAHPLGVKAFEYRQVKERRAGCRRPRHELRSPRTGRRGSCRSRPPPAGGVVAPLIDPGPTAHCEPHHAAGCRGEGMTAAHPGPAAAGDTRP